MSAFVWWKGRGDRRWSRWGWSRTTCPQGFGPQVREGTDKGMFNNLVEADFFAKWRSGLHLNNTYIALPAGVNPNDEVM